MRGGERPAGFLSSSPRGDRQWKGFARRCAPPAGQSSPQPCCPPRRQLSPMRAAAATAAARAATSEAASPTSSRSSSTMCISAATIRTCPPISSKFPTCSTSSSNGTILTNHHTPLISHTADDIITTLTGVYGEKHGQPVANSYGFFSADGSVELREFLRLLDGCRAQRHAADDRPGRQGAASAMGPLHPRRLRRGWLLDGQYRVRERQWRHQQRLRPQLGRGAEAKANFDMAVADFEGISIHCAQGSTLCAGGQTGPLA